MVVNLRSRLRPRSSRSGASPDIELRRARAIVLVGLLLWVAIGLAVQFHYGTIASFVVVGWGGSILVCLALTVGPLGLAWRRQLHDPPSAEVVDEPPAPAPPPRHHAVDPVTDVIDLRAAAAPTVEEQVRALLDQQT